jgi:hypothetical protein
VLQILEVGVAVEGPPVDAARPAAPVAGLRSARTGIVGLGPASAAAAPVQPRAGRDGDLPRPARLAAPHEASPPLAWLPGSDQPTKPAGTAKPEPHRGSTVLSAGRACRHGLGAAASSATVPCPHIRSASGRPYACALTRQVWPVDQAISPSPRASRDVAGGNRRATAPEPRGPRRQLCTAMVVPGSHRPAVRHGSAPLAVSRARAWQADPH